ncbi:hypothetical protein GCM10022224_036590 [Nonomuraea antimicrobica]|uniref:Uncharacterized protein n=1 Tax=Nonomuraea antimicrobica TaxID=561173 RepID=A0ABP7BV39_9ACTN
MFTTIFTIAALISLACLAVPVSIFVRMLIDGPRVRARIRTGMSAVRCEHLTHRDTDQ